MNQGIIIKAANLKISYGKYLAFSAESLDVSGKTIAIIGHNGSGKTTLIKSLLKLMPFEGQLDIFSANEGKKTLLLPEHDMVFSPERGAVFEDLTVESYIKLWCRIKQRDGNYYKKAGNKFIERLNIAPLLSKLGRELSKGQRQRIQAVIGFLTGAALFLFDEPFDGLDIKQSNELASIMLEESNNISLIVSSHRIEVIERLADLIVVLKNGEVLSTGSVEKVCSDLCGQSICLSPEDKSVLPNLLVDLKQSYPFCLINQIGSQIILTGGDISINSIKLFLHQRTENNILVEIVRPSLVDAMNYNMEKSQV